MVSLGIAVGVIILIGAAFLWGAGNKVKAFLFVLLMLSTIFIGYANVGRPRISYIWGVPAGNLISFYIDYNQTYITLWIAPQDLSMPISVNIPYSDKQNAQLQNAKLNAGPHGTVHITGIPNIIQRLLNSLSGKLYRPHPNESQKKGKPGIPGYGNAPFTVPFLVYPQPWMDNPAKDPPSTYSGQ